MTRHSNDEIDIIELFGKIFQKKMTIILIAVLLMVPGAIYSILSTPMYKSEISIYPTTDEGGVAGALSDIQGIASAFGFNMESGSGTTFYIPDVAMSRRISKEIVLRKWHSEEYDKPVNLISYWEIDDNTKFTRRVKRWIKGLFPSDKTGDPQRKYTAAAVGELEDRVSVIEEDSGLIIINVLMEEPQVAADIANYYIQFIKTYIAEELEIQSRKYREFIEERLASAVVELSESEVVLTNFRKKHTMVLEPPDIQLERGRLRRNVEVNQQVYITLKQQFEIAKIEELKELPIINVLDIAEPAAEKSKPKRLLIIAASFILGLFIGAIWVIFRISIQSNTAQD